MRCIHTIVFLFLFFVAGLSPPTTHAFDGSVGYNLEGGPSFHMMEDIDLWGLRLGGDFNAYKDAATLKLTAGYPIWLNRLGLDIELELRGGGYYTRPLGSNSSVKTSWSPVIGAGFRIFPETTEKIHIYGGVDYVFAQPNPNQNFIEGQVGGSLNFDKFDLNLGYRFHAITQGGMRIDRATPTLSGGFKF